MSRCSFFLLFPHFHSSKDFNYCPDSVNLKHDNFLDAKIFSSTANLPSDL
jgi:hypothetical protein